MLPRIKHFLLRIMTLQTPSKYLRSAACCSKCPDASKKSSMTFPTKAKDAINSDFYSARSNLACVNRQNHYCNCTYVHDRNLHTAAQNCSNKPVMRQLDMHCAFTSGSFWRLWDMVYTLSDTKTQSSADALTPKPWTSLATDGDWFTNITVKTLSLQTSDSALQWKYTAHNAPQPVRWDLVTTSRAQREVPPVPSPGACTSLTTDGYWLAKHINTEVHSKQLLGKYQSKHTRDAYQMNTQMKCKTDDATSTMRIGRKAAPNEKLSVTPSAEAPLSDIIRKFGNRRSMSAIASPARTLPCG